MGEVEGGILPRSDARQDETGGGGTSERGGCGCVAGQCAIPAGRMWRHLAEEELKKLMEMYERLVPCTLWPPTEADEGLVAKVVATNWMIREGNGWKRMGERRIWRGYFGERGKGST